MTLAYAFALSLFCHIGICRATRPTKFVIKSLAVGIVGIIALAAANGFAGKTWILEAYIFFSAWILYVMAFINLLNSVTLSMLSLLQADIGNTASRARLSAALSDDSGFDERYEIMEQNGLIIHRDNTITLTPAGLRLAQAVSLVRKLLAIC